MFIKRNKKGQIKIHMGGKLPSEDDLIALNQLGDFRIRTKKLCDHEHSILVQVHYSSGGGATTMECPLNQTFTV